MTMSSPLTAVPAGDGPTIAADSDGRHWTLALAGRWTTTTVGSVDERLHAVLPDAATEAIVDLSAVSALDTAGAWLVYRTARALRRRDVPVDVVGSTVSLHGVPVGEVRNIGIDPDDVERVRVTIEVTAETPVRQDTVASLEQQGITGVANVLLSGGSQRSPPLVAAAGEPRPIIVSQRSSLEQVLEGAPELVASLNLLVARANNLLSPRNQRAIASTLDTISQFSGAAAESSEDLQLLLSDSAGAMAGLREASTSFQRLADRLVADSARLSARADTTLGAVEGAAGAIEATLAGGTDSEIAGALSSVRASADAVASMATAIELLVAENRGPISSFTSETLFEVSAFLNEARALLDGLYRVTTQVERDPARFLFGNQQQGYETVE